MRFETKREREQRRKRQKRSAILGMVFAMLVVVGLGVLLWNGKKNIEAKNVGYEKQIKELQEQVDEEKQRTEELNEVCADEEVCGGDCQGYIWTYISR